MAAGTDQANKLRAVLYKCYCCGVWGVGSKK